MADLKIHTITLPDGTKTQRAMSDRDMEQFLQNNSGDPDARGMSDMDLNRYKGLFEKQRAMSDMDLLKTDLRAMSDKDLKTYSISIRGGQQQILALTPQEVYDLMRNYGPDASITPVDSSGIGSLRPMR